MRANQKLMGTGVSIDVPGLTEVQVMEKVFRRLRQIDNRYSSFKPRSELSRFRRGELRQQELSREFREVMQACLEMEKLTGGYFSAWFGGSYDPTGYVKGWAIEQASQVIEKAGFSTYCVGIGGDIKAASSSDKVWSIGLQDPFNKDRLIGRIKAGNIAVATSGLYERGQHIFDPKTGKPVQVLASVTVAGPDITYADVFATTAFVIGRDGLAFIEEQPGYEGLVVDKSGQALGTSGIKNLLT